MNDTGRVVADSNHTEESIMNLAKKPSNAEEVLAIAVHDNRAQKIIEDQDCSICGQVSERAIHGS